MRAVCCGHERTRRLNFGEGVISVRHQQGRYDQLRLGHPLLDAPLARLPLPDCAMPLAAIKFTRHILFRHGLDELVLDPLP